ncbi:MAG: DNA alkylation repair protein [Erysipelotrichaceae bacterium]|nr:DNA alkylation repair protein [Erysipelotrichaceae bacterium]
MVSKIQQQLLSMKDEEYRDFHLRIVGDTKYEIIGIRLPKIRQLTKQLLKEKQDIVFEDHYYEEVLLHGLFIAGYKCPFDEKITMIERYLPLIDNWAICDSFVSSLKEIRKHSDEYYPFILKYLDSEEEFIQRYALVVLLNHYINDSYLNELYRIIREEKYNGYYSLMAGAWLLSYLFMFYFDETLIFVKENTLDDFIMKKGIRKALDSYRLNLKQKEILRSL